MTDREPAVHEDPLRRAIHRARAELRERLDSEAGRRQRELAELSQRMRRRAAEIAERRLAREREQLEANAHGSGEPAGPDAGIEAVRARFLTRVRATIDGLIAELATKAATQREQLAGRLEAGIAAAERGLHASAAAGSRRTGNGAVAEEIAAQVEKLEEEIARQRERELRENREALDAVRGQLAAEIQQLRRDASETIGARLASADRQAEERERRHEVIEERIRVHAEQILEAATSAVERLRAEDLSAIRTEVASLRVGTGRELERLQAQIAGARPPAAPVPPPVVSGRGTAEEAIRSAADRAERRLVETARIAEAAVAARAEAAAAAALCEITARAAAVAKTLERHERRLEAEVRFGEITEQITNADQRRRSGDLRTRTALSELRA